MKSYNLLILLVFITACGSETTAYKPKPPVVRVEGPNNRLGGVIGLEDPNNPLFGSKELFVYKSAETHNGNLGGKAGADTICKRSAELRGEDPKLTEALLTTSNLTISDLFGEGNDPTLQFAFSVPNIKAVAFLKLGVLTRTEVGTPFSFWMGPNSNDPSYQCGDWTKQNRSFGFHGIVMNPEESKDVYSADCNEKAYTLCATRRK